MPDFNTKISVSTFQQCDGTNFSTSGIDTGLRCGRANLGVYGGIGTSFDNKSTGAIIDFKGSMPYANGQISGGFRIRNNINGNSQTIQFRLQPATVTIPIGDKTQFYATPYIAEKISYKTGKADTSFGGFAGISQCIGKASIFIEGQLYNFNKVNAKNSSINAGVSVPL